MDEPGSHKEDDAVIIPLSAKLPSTKKNPRIWPSCRPMDLEVTKNMMKWSFRRSNRLRKHRKCRQPTNPEVTKKMIQWLIRRLKSPKAAISTNVSKSLSKSRRLEIWFARTYPQQLITAPLENLQKRTCWSAKCHGGLSVHGSKKCWTRCAKVPLNGSRFLWKKKERFFVLSSRLRIVPS